MKETLRPKLSVVIPAFNEEARIGSTLARISGYFADRNEDFEIVVVDDGSSDETVSVVSRFTESHPRTLIQLLQNERNRGKGFSVRRGMLRCGGRYALLTDADLSTPIQEFEKLKNEVVDGRADIAVGSRDIEGARVEVHQSWIRENSGKLYNLFVRVLTGLPFKDTQCGFKLFDMRWKEALFGKQRIERFGFDVELLMIASKLGLTVREVPVVWRHDEGSKVHFLKDGSRMLLDLLQVRWNQFLGRYRSDNLQ